MKTLVLAGLALAGATGAALADTQVIPVGQLLSIDVAGDFRTEITTGPVTSAVLEGSAAELRRVEARVRGTRLQVHARNSFGADKDDIDVVLRITAPILQKIEVSKGGSATAVGLNTTALQLDASMGGALEAQGVCNNLEARARMGGALDAQGLVCRDVVANASMGGMTHVNATQRVVGHASMGGVVEIDGAPPQHDAFAFMGGIVDND